MPSDRHRLFSLFGAATVPLPGDRPIQNRPGGRKSHSADSSASYE